MIRALLYSLTVATVAAFATTSSRVNNRAQIAMATGDDTMSKSVPFLLKPKNTAGLIGDSEFDPLGFSDSFDIKWMREAELKHGRVSMLAVVGYLIQQVVHLPSPDGLYDVANPIDAFFKVGPSVTGQIFLGLGILEYFNHNGKLGMTDMHEGKSIEDVGAFSNPIYGASQLKGKTPAYIADIKLKELKNGRLAMIAIGGMIHHTIISGTEVLGTFPNPQFFGSQEFNIWREFAN